MKIDGKNKFSYSENEEFEDLSEFDIEEDEVAPAEVAPAVEAEKTPVYEEMPTPEYEEEPAAEAYEEETYYPEPDGVTAQGVVGSIDIRPSFIERLMEMDESVIE